MCEQGPIANTDQSQTNFLLILHTFLPMRVTCYRTKDERGPFPTAREFVRPDLFLCKYDRACLSRRFAFRGRHQMPHDGFDSCTHMFVLSIHFWLHGLLDQLSICILIYACGLNPPNTTFLSL